MSIECATRRGLAAAVLAAALGGTSAGWAAAPDDRAAARRHSSQAEELKKKGQLAEACKHLEEAERLDPKLPTLMDLAECSEQAGYVVEARAQWASARDRAKHDEKPQSKARAETRLAAVEKRIAHLTLQLAASAAAGALVLLDDVAVDAASLGSALENNPGDHVILVKLAGHDDAKFSIKLADGDNQALAVAPGPVAAAASPAAPPSVPFTPSPALPALATPAASSVAEAPQQEAPAPTGWWSAPRKAGVVFGSLGVVGVGVGSALCVSGSGKDSASQSVTLGAISIVSGSVLFISGLVLLAGSSSDEPAQHAGMPVMPTLLVARNGAVFGAAGAF